MELLNVSSRPQGRYAVITLTGELDLSTAPRLEQEVRTARTAHGPHLLFDLSGLDFLDSHGLRVLLRARRQAAEQDGSLSLVSPTPTVDRVLQVTGLREHLVVHETLEAALAAEPSVPAPAPESDQATTL